MFFAVVMDRSELESEGYVIREYTQLRRTVLAILRLKESLVMTFAPPSKW